LGDTTRPIIFFEPEKRWPNVYRTDMEYASNPRNSRYVIRIPIINWTVLHFNYEADPKKQAQNRSETRARAGGMRGSKINGTDAHEVAYASTKQGGNNSETIMQLIPKGENRSHGSLLGLAYEDHVDGDPLFVILIPDKKQLPVPVPVPTPPKNKNDFDLEKMRRQIEMLPKRRAPQTGYPGQGIEQLIEKYFKVKIPFIFSPTPVPAPAPAPAL